MNLSFWERQTWLHEIDYALVGSGIVGLNCALALRKQHPNAKIVIFERGILPSGASTKNAGFACFGSVSEMLDDLNSHSEEEVIELVKERVSGLQLLRNTLGDTTIDYQCHGGYEVFLKKDATLFEQCKHQMPYINELMQEVFEDKEPIFSLKKDDFGFQNTHDQLLFNRLEGQLDTGKMMRALLKKASENDILILNSCEVTQLQPAEGTLTINDTETLQPKKICIATNGFAKQLLSEEVKPARAQVLITKPIPNLSIKGTFHLDKGYYYFRNIGDRLLFGGGRNLDFQGEETTEMVLTETIQQQLEQLLKHTILPEIPFEIEQRWSGIMGVGDQKKPILKQIAPTVFCGVRLGGMGVAIGSAVGKKLAALTLS
ncbi:FAD-binding oxidoreductase [Flavobacteriaceae bacterium TK19130]|nr:FAD-binding oxidoreductase [Thermobacterium salinum]